MSYVSLNGIGPKTESKGFVVVAQNKLEEERMPEEEHAISPIIGVKPQIDKVETKRDAEIQGLIGELKSKDSDERWKIENELIGIGKDAVPFLIDALKDKEESVRAGAAETLGRMREKSAIPALTKMLLNKERRDGYEAAEALGLIGDKSAVPALIKALETDWKEGYPLRQICAAEALGEIGHKDAVPALKKAMQNKEESIRRHAVESLCKIGEFSFLIAALKMDEYKNARYEIIGNLGVYKVKSSIPVLLDIMKSEKEDGLYRGEAAESLGMIGDRSVIPALKEALKMKDIWHVGPSAALGLWYLGEISFLLENLKNNPAEHIRVNIVEGLGYIRGEWSEELVGALRTALEDESIEVRRSIARVTWNHCRFEKTYPAFVKSLLFKKAILETLEYEIDYLGFTWTESLGYAFIEFGVKSDIPFLFEILKDRNKYEDVRVNIAQVLGRIGDSSIVPELKETLLNDPSQKVRREGAFALCNIASEMAEAGFDKSEVRKVYKESLIVVLTYDEFSFDIKSAIKSRMAKDGFNEDEIKEIFKEAEIELAQ